jgi:hypothetical protein
MGYKVDPNDSKKMIPDGMSTWERGQPDFQVLSGSITYTNTYNEVQAVNGNASVKMITVLGDDYATDGSFTSGDPMTILEGDIVKGQFTRILVNSGYVIAKLNKS